MKFFKVLTILVAICTLMYGCESNIEKEKMNILYPMEVKSNINELVKSHEVFDSTVLLAASLDESISKCKIIVESYKNGDLIGRQNEFVIEVENELDLAIFKHDSANWEIKARSGNDIISADMDALGEFGQLEDYLEVWEYLDYQVNIELNKPQIIAINYFDDSGMIAHEVSVYEKNSIIDKYRYEYMYVLKLVFE